ncbi:MAG: transcriptional regulator NrdR [bacterium]
MKCPFCGFTEDKVIESRATLDDTAIRRRRECIKCEKRYTSYERIEGVELRVVKRDGRREPYNREKIISGIVKALEKRPVPMNIVNSVVDEIEKQLHARYQEEVPAKDIGELVIERLHDIDKVAYVRFASVYRQFEDVRDFVDEVKSMPKTASVEKGE